MSNDTKTTINDIKKKIKDFNSARGWHKDIDPKNISEALIVEAAELLELFRWKDVDLSREIALKDSEKRERIEEELADVFIYGFDMALALDMDITDIVHKKMEKNAKKYPV